MVPDPDPLLPELVTVVLMRTPLESTARIVERNGVAITVMLDDRMGSWPAVGTVVDSMIWPATPLVSVKDRFPGPALTTKLLETVTVALNVFWPVKVWVEEREAAPRLAAVMTPCWVTEEVRPMKEVVVPCNATLIVLESKTTFVVGRHDDGTGR